MTPTLAAVGSGLAWFAATGGQLLFFGLAIGIGLWASKKVTNLVDLKLAERLDRKEQKRNARHSTASA